MRDVWLFACLFYWRYRYAASSLWLCMRVAHSLWIGVAIPANPRWSFSQINSCSLICKMTGEQLKHHISYSYTVDFFYWRAWHLNDRYIKNTRVFLQAPPLRTTATSFRGLPTGQTTILVFCILYFLNLINKLHNFLQP